MDESLRTGDINFNESTHELKREYRRALQGIREGKEKCNVDVESFNVIAESFKDIKHYTSGDTTETRGKNKPKDSFKKKEDRTLKDNEVLYSVVLKDEEIHKKSGQKPKRAAIYNENDQTIKISGRYVEPHISQRLVQSNAISVSQDGQEQSSSSSLFMN